MPTIREVIKRALPQSARAAVIRLREWAAAPPLEEIALHDYAVSADASPGRRLTLVIPHIDPALAFGGIVTGLELVFGLARRTGAPVRIVLDDFGAVADRSIVDKAARAAGIDPAAVQIEPRTQWVPRLAVRDGDVFMGFHTWIVLNLVPVLAAQVQAFGGAPRPLLYPIQEYEPLFYPMSSTHLLARAAFDLAWPCWGMFNSRELHAYFMGQGHKVARAFVFEPKLAAALRPYLDGEPPAKTRQILVYGRPGIPRNCFPAVVAGLRRWAAAFPSQGGWQVVSAGLPHRPVKIAPGRAIRSLGKLPLAEYAATLRESAVGISLMASPHPSYPPLEMAHFGLRTITNAYGPAKDLSASHPNIVSVPDILPATLASALGAACAAFEAAPGAGWGAPSGRRSFLDEGPHACLDEIAGALAATAWRQ
jgi:hypothetical protein